MCIVSEHNIFVFHFVHYMQQYFPTYMSWMIFYSVGLGAVGLLQQSASRWHIFPKQPPQHIFMTADTALSAPLHDHSNHLQVSRGLSRPALHS